MRACLIHLDARASAARLIADGITKFCEHSLLMAARSGANISTATASTPSRTVCGKVFKERRGGLFGALLDLLLAQDRVLRFLRPTKTKIALVSMSAASVVASAMRRRSHSPRADCASPSTASRCMPLPPSTRTHGTASLSLPNIWRAGPSPTSVWKSLQTVRMRVTSS